MKTAILLGAGLGLALALPGVASANTGGGSGTGQVYQQSSQNSAGAPASARRLHHELQQAGFTNIRIQPHSYLVQAKDPDGNPVRIVVSPTAVAVATRNEQSGGNQSGGQGMMQGHGQGMMQGQSQGMQGNGMHGWNG